MENKKTEITIIQETKNIRKIIIENPSEKLLQFCEDLKQRKEQRKKDILSGKYDNADFIQI